MGYEDIIKQFGSQEFLDKLYGFAYKRCSDSHTAEDLCSEIIVKALSSARRNPQIEYVHAYIWAVAHRVYADFCEKRRIDGERLTMDEFSVFKRAKRFAFYHVDTYFKSGLEIGWRSL